MASKPIEMYRASAVTNDIEKRELLSVRETLVTFRSLLVPTRIDREHRICMSHGWFATEKAAYKWMIDSWERRYKEIVEEENKVRHGLGRARKAYRDKFGPKEKAT